MSTDFTLKKEIEQFGVYVETSQQQLINKKLESKYEEIFEDLKKLSKYIVYDTNIYVMVDFENPKEQGMNNEQGMTKAQRMNKAQGITKPVKPNMFSREADGYTIFIRADRVDALAHELCHVIDRVGTKNQFSNQKEFKPLLDMYKQAHKKEIKRVKSSNMTDEDKKKIINYWNDTYRNGNAKSEIFARFCEYYLLDKEKLNITLQEVEPFDELCIIVYMEHKELINSYFDELFQQVHEQTSSETNDNEFDDALYLIDAEYNSRNITL